MNKFEILQKKLDSFIKKYYANEIIKGSILFLSFGLLYFIFTLFLEYFLWLKPLSRTILFYFFIAVETGLLFRFIVIPILKIIGFKSGISLSDASKIIGSHFKDVDDKLLNVIQLSQDETQSDLLLASIAQKADQLQPIPFRNAVDFKSNWKYIKFLVIPIFIWITIFFSGNISVFTQSWDRVVHHKMAYAPPAPYTFTILNNLLEAIEGKKFILRVATVGSIIPEDVKINFNGESYYLKKQNTGEFSYVLEYPVESFSFSFEGGGYESADYFLEVVKTPKIVNFEMFLDYPSYTQRKDETVKNTGNAFIPEGTNVTWKISSVNTNSIVLSSLSNMDYRKEDLTNDFAFENTAKDFYVFKKIVRDNFDYFISTSNNELKNFENLTYKLSVIKDNYPKIIVKSDIDSLTKRSVQFIGQLSDDYGLTKLRVIAKNLMDNELCFFELPVSKSDFDEFYYVLPEGLALKKGHEYEIYFEIFDNDAIRGSKRTVSQSFFYRNKSDSEINEELIFEQREYVKLMENTTKNSIEIEKALESLSNKLMQKEKLDWNDKKELDKFLERQKKYQEILKDNSQKLLDNLDSMEENPDSELNEKKSELMNRMEETKELLKKEDLLKQLIELADKLKKEDLLQNVDRLREQNKQKTRSLERILELTKRFYVEKKLDRIVNKLKTLSNEQLELFQRDTNTLKEQMSLNQKFDSLQKDFMEMDSQNKALSEPLDLPDTKADEKLIEMEMNKAEEDLKNGKNSEAKKSSKLNQKSASDKMKQLAEKMKDSMKEIEMEILEENIEDLKQILDNLILFSFEQEDVMLSFQGINSKNSNYPEKLKKQQILKEYFEHIDDSLYMLSIRMVKLSSIIQTEIEAAHYNLDESLQNIAENNIDKGMSNQQYTMTAANNLASMLSDILQNLEDQKMGSGKGKGKNGEELVLPDIIKKQNEIIKRANGSEEPGKESGGKGKEQMSYEQYQIYQEQSQLRMDLHELLKKGGMDIKMGNEASEEMLKLEKLLLEKGLTKEVKDQMRNLEYELLKLNDAVLDQNKENQRKSDTNINAFKKRYIRNLNEDRLFFNQNENLNRQNLPLNLFYKEKVKNYFEEK